LQTLTAPKKLLFNLRFVRLLFNGMSSIILKDKKAKKLHSGKAVDKGVLQH
ncbi:Hypothetical protein FKW44_005829, partial [Caligus rogercresseyi]